MSQAKSMSTRHETIGHPLPCTGLSSGTRVRVNICTSCARIAMKVSSRLMSSSRRGIGRLPNRAGFCTRRRIRVCRSGSFHLRDSCHAGRCRRSWIRTLSWTHPLRLDLVWPRTCLYSCIELAQHSCSLSIPRPHPAVASAEAIFRGAGSNPTNDLAG